MSSAHALDDSLLAAFATVRRPGVLTLVRRGFEPWVGVLSGEEDPGAGSAVVWGGREAHPLVHLPNGGRAVVRRYRRGGAMRHLNRDLYFLGHRAMEELRATERARHAGVRAPEVLAATERRRGIAYTATLATRWIPDAVDLSLWIRGRSPVELSGALFAAGFQLARMHAGGVAHPDVNLRNLLVAGRSENLLVYLLDFDRARVGDGPVSRGRRSRDLLRLARSARKLGAPIGAAGWAALRDGYGDEWPLDRDLG